ncbi:TM0106 family RecB-like putative nuclease [Cupriavidus sp. KB_39]|uniref:TM0106 family RecB-like putative nuclease n=1 Tax=Cupriavidus sp. KB_39 TaxID=3233036 RepID=UPI003F93A783
MQKKNGSYLFSASDIVSFLECEHSTTLGLQNLETPLEKAPEDPQLKLIQDKGLAHEKAYFEKLIQGRSWVDVNAEGDSVEARVTATRKAMQEGVDVIFQAAFLYGQYLGYADFLVRVDSPSQLGAYSYEVQDTKLARSARGKFIIQLCFYSWLLSREQGTMPQSMQVVLGSGHVATFRVADYFMYFRDVLARFERRIAEGEAVNTYPDPCDKCSQCEWINLCDGRRSDDDHLSYVANISKAQIKKLSESGVTTLAELAVMPAQVSIPKLAPKTLERLRAQAALQLKARNEGGIHLELLPKVDQGLRGFERLPMPSAGDMYFDMEGDPLEEGGLEYLFGLYIVDDGVEEFVPFWAHTRAEERLAFERFIDFVYERLRKYPDAHIYHYAAYEATALKKLMSMHGTREAEVDGLLRRGKLVDLYKVVREALLISEPSYSIKYVEKFYLGQRVGDVTNAGASILYYEKWKETKDPRLLQEIADYNRDDVLSTFKLHQWLCQLRPEAMPWAILAASASGAASPTVEVGEKKPIEVRLEEFERTMCDGIPEREDERTEQDQHRLVAYQLLDYHRREQKPEWWAYFDRMDMTEAEMIEDVECIGGATLDRTVEREKVKASYRYTYRFPPQETKLRGPKAMDLRSSRSLSNVQVLHGEGRLTFTLGAKSEAPDVLALGPDRPVGYDVIVDAVFRYAASLGDAQANAASRFPAIDDLLRRRLPRIHNIPEGRALIDEAAPLLPQVVEAVLGMQETTLFLQGPPGAGKTYTGSRVILALLQAGKRVGVSSNSHHAINNLLRAVEVAAAEQSFVFSGVKKSSKDQEDGWIKGELIRDVFENEEVSGSGAQLLAGTAWLFSREELEGELDYLFVDEAGQVSLGNVVGMGISARNIVLLGDQMQLGQPTKGVHPGNSGQSVLEYLLDGLSTIPAAQGIFLNTTYRMHPDVCEFISEAIYDGRLTSHEKTARQGLVLNEAAHSALAPSGIRFVPVIHDGNAQESQEEADVIRDLYASLLEQEFLDGEGNRCRFTPGDILVVAPYNMQVNLLRKCLPAGARIGTVDKFQGQEAQVVIISMATSNADYLPRNIEFLFSKNRLNVAPSRAKSLALLVASPELTSIRCKTPEQMTLVNTLCWVGQTSVQQAQR